MEIIQTFPSLIIIDYIKERVDQLDIPNQKFIGGPTNENLPISEVRGQYSTKNIRILKDHPRIEKIFLKAFKKVPLGYKNDFKITTSWGTKMEKNEVSNFHNHKNTFWSGVFYPEDSDGDIEFRNPCTNLTSFFIEPKEYNIYNANGYYVKPRKNMIIFFPSYLEHRICAHKNENPRYSLAFNMVPIGDYGSADSSYNTSWFR